MNRQMIEQQGLAQIRGAIEDKKRMADESAFAQGILAYKADRDTVTVTFTRGSYAQIQCAVRFSEGLGIVDWAPFNYVFTVRSPQVQLNFHGEDKIQLSLDGIFGTCYTWGDALRLADALNAVRNYAAEKIAGAVNNLETELP